MNDRPKLLIVEDDAQIARQLKWALVDDYDIHLAKDASSALKMVTSKNPEVVTLDLGLPPRPQEAVVGMKLLKQMLQYAPRTKIVVVTGNDDRENAMQAIGQGAWDYYHKPVNIEELKMILRRAFHVFALERENMKKQKNGESKAGFEGLIGSSTEMNKVYDKIRKVAPSAVSVLVLGESGPIEIRGNMNLSERGEVFVDGILVDRLQIVTFEQPYALRKAGNSLFFLNDPSQSEIEVEHIRVKQGFLEESNVNPIEEMVAMMTLYRYFEADQKAIQTQDEILQQAVNEIGKV